MIQLKLKTEFTFGQTFAPIGRMIDRLKAIGCTAAGIVDIKSTWGHVPWFKACQKAGIQPLLGLETVVSDAEAEETQRMWFLAKTKAGLSELYRAASKSYQQPVITKIGEVPRLYRADVLGMSDAIFRFAGDITDGDFLKDAGAYLDFSPASRLLTMAKTKLIASHGLRPVGISDNFYPAPEDRQTYEFASYSSLKQTPQHILTELEYQETAKEIAAACAGLILPTAPMVRAEGDLEAVCRAGIIYRGMQDRWTQEYEDRLNYELELIRSKDFESYFIVVADMVHYAKQHMLVGPSRGSAAGSLVCYLARITEIDPLPPKLFFERFIDITRTDLPDIDLDFPDDKREMVFKYMAEKYGFERVAHIGTVSQFKPRSALVQVCKALNIPPAATAALKVAMIERSSADSRATNCLQDTLEQTEPGKAFAVAYPQAVIAQLWEGHASHTGVHAAGLLVCNDEITNYAVVDHNNIAHIDKNSAEMLGLLKIDVLGLRTLGVLEDAGVDVDWYRLPFNDEATFNIFNRQRLCGIFQFEGVALRAIARQIEFKGIGEIDAVTALARPGPFGGGVTNMYVRRRNGEPYSPIHPLVEAHMRETFGLPVYQEQTLAIVREIGKFDWKETSTIRKAMSKRMGKEFFDSYWEKFKAGAGSQGIEEFAARETWEMINAMGAWQMNKAHTYSYAVISYWTAYLKAHFPIEFAAANLRNAKDEESAVELLREMVNEGIEYTAFDLERSEANWCAKDGRLYGGFMSLKGIGDVTADKLVEARNNGTLTAKQIEQIKNADNVFLNLFPISTKYAHLYADPAANGIASEVSKIGDLVEGMPHGHERVFIGELILKNAKNANEEVNVKKRKGKLERGPLDYVDMRVRDDTGQIGGRINRYDYQRIGKDLLEKVPVGAHLLIRAAFYNGIRYAFVKKWRRLDEPEKQ